MGLDILDSLGYNADKVVVALLSVLLWMDGCTGWVYSRKKVLEASCSAYMDRN